MFTSFKLLFYRERRFILAKSLKINSLDKVTIKLLYLKTVLNLKQIKSNLYKQ